MFRRLLADQVGHEDEIHSFLRHQLGDVPLGHLGRETELGAGHLLAQVTHRRGRPPGERHLVTQMVKKTPPEGQIAVGRQCLWQADHGGGIRHRQGARFPPELPAPAQQTVVPGYLGPPLVRIPAAHIPPGRSLGDLLDLGPGDATVILEQTADLRTDPDLPLIQVKAKECAGRLAALGHGFGRQQSHAVGSHDVAVGRNDDRYAEDALKCRDPSGIPGGGALEEDALPAVRPVADHLVQVVLHHRNHHPGQGVLSAESGLD